MLPDDADGAVLSELRHLWVTATPDSIAGDLDRARDLVERASSEEREAAESYLDALEKLERWLHDV